MKSRVSVAVPRADSGVEVVHTVPGRLRLRALGKNAGLFLEEVASQLRRQKGIEEVQTNVQTGSLLIIFDAEKLSLSRLYELVQSCGVSEVIEPSSETGKAALDADAWKKAGIQLQSFIPLIVGLLTTRQLGLHGWRSLPVYMLTASAVRQVMAILNMGELPSEGELSQPTAAELNEKKIAADTETDNQAVQPSTVAYRVVHSVPGRIRFRIPQVAHNLAYIRQLQRLVKADPKVAEVQINPVTASVIFTYEPKLHSEMGSYLRRLIQTAGDAVVPKEVIAQGSRTTKPEPLKELSDQWTVEDRSNSSVSADSTFKEESQFEVSEVTALVELPTQSTPESADMNESPGSPPTVDPTSNWSRFKSGALSTMLRLMANQPALEA